MNPNFEKYQLSYIRAVPLKEFRSNSRKRGRKVKKHPIYILHLQEGLTCVRVEKGGVRAGGEKVVGQTCGP